MPLVVEVFVGGHIHEDQLVVLTIQELHVAGLHVGLAHLFAGTEGDVLDASRQDVAQLGADHGTALAGLEVLEVNNFVGDAFHLDLEALAKISRRIHSSSCCRARGLFPAICKKNALRLVYA